MCGSSGGGTTPPPSPPPTTFSYTAADRSNTQRRQAALVGATDQGSPGTVLGSGNTMTPNDTAATGATR